MPKAQPPAPSPAEPSFEEAMERLDEIVGSMEEERLALDEMVGSYEEGARLLSLCRQRIESARQRVERINLLLDGQEGATLEAFTPGADDSNGDAAPPPAAAPRVAKKSPAPADDDDDIRLF